jgi:hypothetical protein
MGELFNSLLGLTHRLTEGSPPVANPVIHNLMHRLWITLYHRLRGFHHFEWQTSSVTRNMSGRHHSE